MPAPPTPKQCRPPRGALRTTRVRAPGAFRPPDPDGGPPEPDGGAARPAAASGRTRRWTMEHATIDARSVLCGGRGRRRRGCPRSTPARRHPMRQGSHRRRQAAALQPKGRSGRCRRRPICAEGRGPQGEWVESQSSTNVPARSRSRSRAGPLSSDGHVDCLPVARRFKPLIRASIVSVLTFAQPGYRASGRAHIRAGRTEGS